MNAPEISSSLLNPSLFGRFICWLFSWRTVRRGLVGLAGFATLTALFYTEENWRGKRAWENCKRELEAKGAVLDWNAYIPPPVPDDQNIFKAPGIKESDWVGRGEKELAKRLNFGALSEFVQQHSIMAELTILSSNAVAPADADLILRYNHSILTIATAQDNLTDAFGPQTPIIPLVVMDDVPLADAIQQLARQAKLNYSLDPKISSGQPGPDGKFTLQHTVSIRWENVAAKRALLALLNNYELLLIDDPKTGIARITMRDPGRIVYAEGAVREQIGKLIQNAIRQSTNGLQGPSATGSQDFTFFAGSLNPIKPAHVFVRADEAPSTNEIAEFFSRNVVAPDARDVRVESAGSNFFRVRLSRPLAYSAADYLAWSSQFESDFDTLRDALKRPYARMDGDYSQPVAIPIPSFITTRITVQTLGNRAECYLLLGQPDKALRQLTLMHDMCRLLEGKPETLVAAMIDVAVTGLYVDTIGDGFRLKAWREPQLVALQAQLKEVNLPPGVQAAFESGRAGSCHTFETATPTELGKVLWFYSSAPSSWQKLKNPLFRYLTLSPRGWIYQNMVANATLEQIIIDSFDPTNNLVLPGKMAAGNREIESFKLRLRPYTFLAAITVPNYIKASQSLARNQTLANETQIVCALERYRLAHGQYPEALGALVPQFIEKLPHDIIGGQPLKYRRTDDAKFILYSVGWNETDDGGQTVLDKDGRPDLERGDWVWQTK